MPAEPSRSAAASRKRQSVRVWGEVGVTVCITENPPQYVKVMFGHERIAPNDDVATLKRTRALVDEYNESVVEEQVEKYKRLALAASGVEDETPQQTSSRRPGRRR